MAANDSGIRGHLPAHLLAYWATGPGAAKWRTKAHPYTALVEALREHPDIPSRMIHGLAANIFRAATGQYPGQRAGKAGGNRGHNT